jgi:hypothetical protein
MDNIVSATLNLNYLVVEKIMGGTNVPPKADIFAAVVADKFRDQKIAKDADACAKKIKELSNFRNEIAHGRWMIVPSHSDTEERFRSLSPVSRKKITEGKTVTLQDLETNYELVCKLSNRMADLFWRIMATKKPKEFAEHSPWHDKF